jgi:hypothetical protein
MRTAPSPLEAEQAVEAELRALDALDLKGLRAVWPARFCPPPKLRSVELLKMILSWRLQAEALGGLSSEARRKLARRGPVEVEGRAHGLGAILRRNWEGRQIEVVVEADGFRFGGKLYASLSAVARAATGTRWNGPRFFGLREPPDR